MISTLDLWIFIIALIILAAFFTWSALSNHKRRLLHSLFLVLAIAYASWLIPLIVLYFVDSTNSQIAFILDCLMQPGGALCAPIYLCIAIVFVKNSEKTIKWLNVFFVIPILF